MSTAYATDDLLVIGGVFARVGLYRAPGGVAAWDGHDWYGFGPGLPGGVSAFAVWNGQLVAGGTFTQAAGASADYLAIWNGATWDPLPEPVNGPVSALNVFEGSLVVGGSFTAGGGQTLLGAAMWDGAQWHDMAGGVRLGGMPGTVYAFQVLRDTLFVGGTFDSAGSVSASNIGAWDGQSWHALSSGLNGVVYSFCTLGDTLVAAGHFGYAGSVIVGSTALWVSGVWSTLDGWGADNEVESITSYGGRVIAAGWFTSIGMLVSCRYVAQWDRTRWQACAEGIQGSWWGYSGKIAPAMAVFQGKCYVGGWFAGAGKANGRNLDAWNGTSWDVNTDGNAVGYDVIDIQPWQGKLAIAGNFLTAGTAPASGVAVWNDTTFSALGSGVNYIVYALADINGTLVMGGGFTSASGSIAKRVATWTGTKWKQLGAGFNNTVYCLQVWNGQLFAGGQFSTSGSTTVSHVAVWSGTAWQPLGTGTDGDVYRLAVWDGKLVAGGTFVHAGGVTANGLAVWDGSTWSAVGGGVTGGQGLVQPGPRVQAVTVFNGQLVIGGNFTAAGGVPAANIAAWDGAAWHPLGTGMTGPATNMGPQVTSLCVYGTRLVAGGSFASAGDSACANLATWDGTTWSSLGGGFTLASPSDGATWVMREWNGALYCGGNMLTAGSTTSWFLAKWLHGAFVTGVWAPHFRSGRENGLAVSARVERARRVIVAVSRPSAGVSRVSIRDVRGREVAVLADGPAPAGRSEYQWDDRRRGGQALARGIYCVLVEDRGVRGTTKVVLVE